MEEQLAASRIAAVKRGQTARRQAEESKQAVTKVAAVQRSRAQRKKKQDEEISAIMIQARMRGKRERARTMNRRVSKQRFFTPSEVARHNTADDCWVSLFRKVLDLTTIIRETKLGHLVQPLIENAGTDITHWFDPETRNVRTYIDPKTQKEVPFTPMGIFLHCPPNEPKANWSSNIGSVWWKDKSLVMGTLTQRTRRIKLENMLTKQNSELEVCAEETLQVNTAPMHTSRTICYETAYSVFHSASWQEIQSRYLRYNNHSASYTWKRTDTNQASLESGRCHGLLRSQSLSAKSVYCASTTFTLSFR